MAKKKKKRSGKAAVEARKKKYEDTSTSIRYRCLECGIEEDIPRGVVETFDTFDDGDRSVPPRFDCENCDGLMEPIEYEGVHGEFYKIKEEEKEEKSD